MRERLGRAARKAGDFVGSVDDNVQGFIRSKVYGLPEDGTGLESKGPGGSFRQLMGYLMHGSRPGNPSKTAYRFENNNAGRAWVAGSRAVQAGALTGAGVGLANLTSAITQFGGPADQQTNQQIAIDYNSPAHGSTLSPESHQTYINVHKGLMEDARINNGYDDQVRAAYSAGEFDHDPKLKNHIADVMG